MASTGFTCDPVYPEPRNPKISRALNELPPKLLTLSSHKPAETAVFMVGDPAEHVIKAKARILGATFTGAGDKARVVAMYKEYVSRIAGALQPLLAFGTAIQAVELPPMPTDPAALRAWHDATLRKQHATIADALSGKRLDTLTGCVRMAIEGVLHCIGRLQEPDPSP